MKIDPAIVADWFPPCHHNRIWAEWVYDAEAFFCNACDLYGVALAAIDLERVVEAFANDLLGEDTRP